MHANERSEIDEVRAGDIAAAVGLRDVTTGDSLTDPRNAITLERMEFPRARHRRGGRAEDGRPITRRWAIALGKLAREDPTFRVRIDAESGQTIMSGMGELHLEIVVERMKREFEVDGERRQAAGRVPRDDPHGRRAGRQVRAPDRRTAISTAQVCLKIEPLPPGHGYEFVNAIAASVVPRECMPAVDAGVREQIASGVIAGYPVVDVKVTVFDGAHRDVESSEVAFKIAGAIAFKEGVRKARPTLLEPIMNVEVVTPRTTLGRRQRRPEPPARRRCRASKMRRTARSSARECRLSEMFGYATALRSLSQGRATYTMEFSQYAEVPANVSQHVIKDRAALAAATS